MSFFMERLRTAKTGVWDRPMLRLRFIRCAFRDGRHRLSHCQLFLASKVGYTGNTVSQKRLVLDSLYPQHFQWVFRGRCSCVKMSRSRGVLHLVFFYAVTTPHHRCLVGDMARDRLVSAGRMLTILGFWRVEQNAPTFISHVSLQV